MSVENPKLLLNEEGSPKDRIVGFETEYGFSCDVSNPADDLTAERYVMHYAHGGQANTYMASGERIYIDVGMHPEFSTAEETSFLGAAHRLLAGHLKMARMYRHGTEEASERLSTGPVGPITLKGTNLIANTADSTGSSWGSHENTLARRELLSPDYIEALAVHNLSRIVWSGAGHVLPAHDNQRDFQFVLSEKAQHIWEIANDCTVAFRPLVNLRDTPYADAMRFRRIHNVTGESIFSPVGNALRLATGSIILRACELGVTFSDLMPENHVRAIRAISADASLRTTVELADGRRFSGLDLQREIAERSLSSALLNDNLTDQEIAWGQHWLELLEDLGNDPEICADRVDWVIKKKLIDRELEAKKDKNESRYAVAYSKSTDYHRLLPGEGAGMKLVRKGFFKDSPSHETLEQGMPLPMNRALLRGEAIRKLNAAGVDFFVNWHTLQVGEGAQPIDMGNPCLSENSRIAAILDRYEESTAESQAS